MNLPFSFLRSFFSMSFQSHKPQNLPGAEAGEEETLKPWSEIHLTIAHPR
jgi:hypothetical protein